MTDEKPAPTPAPDLLERARSEAVNWSATCGRLFDELADEIERLRATLSAARDFAIGARLSFNLDRHATSAATAERMIAQIDAALGPATASPAKSPAGARRPRANRLKKYAFED